MNCRRITVRLILFLLLNYSRTLAGGSAIPSLAESCFNSKMNVTTAPDDESSSSFTGSKIPYCDKLKEVEPNDIAIYSAQIKWDGYISMDKLALAKNNTIIDITGNYLSNVLNGDTLIGTYNVAL